MHIELQAVDPVVAARVHPNDPQRIQRALEVYEITGEPLSAFFAAGREKAAGYRFLKIALVPEDRRELHTRIARRFKQMVEQRHDITKVIDRPSPS